MIIGRTTRPEWVRRGGRAMAAKPIVAGTDGSEESLRAVDWAAREAALRGAPLRIVAAAGRRPGMISRAGAGGYDEGDRRPARRARPGAGRGGRAGRQDGTRRADRHRPAARPGRPRPSPRAARARRCWCSAPAASARSPRCCSARSAGTPPATRPARWWSSGTRLRARTVWSASASATWTPTATCSPSRSRRQACAMRACTSCTPGTRRRPTSPGPARRSPCQAAG